MEIDILSQEFLGNTAQQWLIAIGVWLLSAIILRLALGFLVRRIAVLAERTKTPWDDMVVEALSRTHRIFVLVISFFAGSLILVLPERLRNLTEIVVVMTLLLQVGIWLSALIKSSLALYQKRALEKNPAAVTTIGVIGFLGRVLLWSAITLVALDTFGVDVTALVAGLGIGGVAVALAVQNILGDLFASLSIMLDKPFVVGDFLIIGDFLGSVEHVGLKTTRIRSLSGEQLVFSNSDLLSSRIRNYGRMFERRVVFNLGVTYSTPRDKLKRIPQLIREAVEAQAKTRFDRSHFMKYGDYSLMFETVYYVRSADYNIHMDIQQAIYFQIHESFEREQIEFAFPTQTLHLRSNEAPQPNPAGV